MLPRKYRLQKDRNFKYVYQRGKVVSSNNFLIRYLSNKQGNSRIGIVISKKISNKATVRNRLKRQISVIAEDMIDYSNSNYDIIIGVKKLFKDGFSDIKEQLSCLFKKIV